MLTQDMPVIADHCSLLHDHFVTLLGVPNCCAGCAGTLVGCLPNNFVAVNAGSKLGELKSLADLYDIRLIMLGGGVGVLAMLSVAWKHFAGKQEQVNFAKEA